MVCSAKVAGADQVLRTAGETAGMGLMGLGGLLAIVGGMLFVVIVLRAMLAQASPARQGGQGDHVSASAPCKAAFMAGRRASNAFW